MKKIYAISFLLCVPLLFLSSLDLNHAKMLNMTGNELEAEKEYLILLDSNPTSSEKIEILSALSEIHAMATEGFVSQTGLKKSEFYCLGKKYAEQSLKEEETLSAHIWHATCKIKEARAIGLLNTLAVLRDVKEEYFEIVNSKEGESFSYGWHALGELYYALPQYSVSQAIGCLRKSLDSIPSEELHIATYFFLAKYLLERNDSVQARTSRLEQEYRLWTESEKESNSKRFTYYEGVAGQSQSFKWTDKPLNQMSDKEEARLICEYAVKIYNASEVKYANDTLNYNRIVQLLSEL